MGHDKLSFEAMVPEDIPAVMALEKDSLSAWNKKYLESELKQPAVSQEARQKDFGTQLLNHGLNYCRRHGVERCYLELRTSNTAAKGLYEKCGFSVVGTRKAYYDAPKEDAVLMQREL